MLMQTKYINDRTLLLAAGFSTPTGPDIFKLSLFCGVSERTAYRWLSVGLPERARLQLTALLAGDYLPPEWRQAGIKIANDRLYLHSGHAVMLCTLKRWPFVMQAVDWSKVPE